MKPFSWKSVGVRLSLCLCLLMLLAGQPMPAGAGERENQALAPAAPEPVLPEALAGLDFTALEAGGYFTCALTSGGGVKCWGSNSDGQLGDGTSLDRNAPVDVSGLSSGVTAIAVGYKHACAIVAGGGARCWGSGSYGRLGDGTGYDRSTPVEVVGLSSGVIAIAAGRMHTCAILSGGGARCWGSNNSGQVGDGSMEPYRLTPVDVIGLDLAATAITAGGSHTCTLMQNGGVKCWGDNTSGQLGDGTTSWSRSTPVDVIGLERAVTALALGVSHSCALSDSGGIKCWGSNGLGQLGDGTPENRLTPVDVNGLASGVIAINAEWEHTCALTSPGGVKCWGSNYHGQLGDGTEQDRSTPVEVVGLASGGMAIAAGIYHTCALILGGGAKCWGYNEYGQLGDGPQYQRSLLVDVAGLAGNTAVISAGGLHTCAVTASGGVKCWGDNEFGKLGDTTETDRSLPVDVAWLTSGAASVDAGVVHTCALTTFGGARCWGNNYYGQLGDGTYQGRPNPVVVLGLNSGVSTISAGYLYTCAVTASGGAKCWGDNYNGQLGDGTTENRTTPVDVAGLDSGVTAIAVGNMHTCALLSGGGVKCWGANWIGQLGDGTTENRLTPVDVIGLDQAATAITVGYMHTCAILAGGGVKCWGGNMWGQLGDGTTEDRLTPVEVIGLSGEVTALSTNSNYASYNCALISNGGAMCWGDNEFGQLGDGTTEPRLTPANVIGLAEHVTAINAGGGHTCALAGAGRAKCWGLDSYGQLGIGTLNQQLTPVKVVAYPPPRLTISYSQGQPGSFFTLSGWNFPPEAQVALVINGETITTTLTPTPTGSFLFFLDAGLAEPGGYAVTVSVVPLPGGDNIADESRRNFAADPLASASAGFILAGDAPLQPQEGGGLTFTVPAGNALHNFVYLPLLNAPR